MARQELVSIIMPAYKAAHVIEQAIGSVIAQTYPAWELLVAEDCGPDDTRQIVRGLAVQDDRIRLIEAEANGGPAASRNLALDAATGRWIAFLDSDDMWLPHKLERQLSFHAAHPGAVLSYTSFRRIDETGTDIGHKVTIPPDLSYRGLLGNTAIATSTVIVDRQVSGRFRMERTYYDDFVCWLTLLKRHGKAIGLDEDLMRYRVMAQSVSRNKLRSMHEVWKTYRKVEGLNPLSSLWYFARYTMNAALKYRRF